MNDLKGLYQSLKPKYEGLVEAVRFSLEKMISNKNISLLNLEARVKTFESIENKTMRKKYEVPLESIEDICGLRVICYYTSDMDVLEKLIKNEFEVISSSDKQKEAEDDRFGYQSRHYIVKLKKSWLAMPLFSDFEQIKLEIQIRTMLMHSWAAISHKLLYKKETDAPRELKRKLNRLSALIELADEQFESIKEFKEKYFEELGGDEVEKNIPINSDGLISLINKYSPGRVLDESSIPAVVDEIAAQGLTIADFEDSIKRSLRYLDVVEREHAKEEPWRELPLWHVSGFARVVMDLTDDDYFLARWGSEVGSSEPPVWLASIMKYRQKIK